MYPIHIITSDSTIQRVDPAIKALESSQEVFIHQHPNWKFTLRVKTKKSILDQYKKYIDIFRIISKTKKSALVLEDDALAQKGWGKVLLDNKKIIENADLTFLSTDFFDHEMTPIDDNFSSVRMSKATCATIFSPKAAVALLKYKFICRYPMDWQINHMLEKRKDLSCIWHNKGIFVHGTVEGVYQTSIIE
jgi:hypothetical protein